jgi:hypothetical protein
MNNAFYNASFSSYLKDYANNNIGGLPFFNTAYLDNVYYNLGYCFNSIQYFSNATNLQSGFIITSFKDTLLQLCCINQNHTIYFIFTQHEWLLAYQYP